MSQKTLPWYLLKRITRKTRKCFLLFTLLSSLYITMQFQPFMGFWVIAGGSFQEMLHSPQYGEQVARQQTRMFMNMELESLCKWVEGKSQIHHTGIPFGIHSLEKYGLYLGIVEEIASCSPNSNFLIFWTHTLQLGVTLWLSSSQWNMHRSYVYHTQISIVLEPKYLKNLFIIALAYPINTGLS